MAKKENDWNLRAAKTKCKIHRSYMQNGEIRSKEQFELNCKELKLDPLIMYKKCESLFKKNNLGTLKGTIRNYEKADEQLSI